MYLYVCYHDPVVGVDRSQTNGRGVLREWFEIDQQTEPLTGREIELCRVRLRGRHYELYSPQNYLDPQINELDFRYRRRARWRPWKTVRVGVLDNAEFEEFNEEIDRSIDGLGDLVESLDGLYPQLHGVREIDRLQMGRENTSLTFFIIESRPDGDLESQRSPSEIAHHYDALYLGSAWQNILLNEVQIRLLRDYIEAGGMLWIEVPQNAERLPILSSLESIYGGKQDWQDLDRRHPVRTQPFAFQRLPAGEALEPIQFKVLGDILLCEGLLSLAWGVSFPLELDRAEIRAAQELGINILNFFQYLREQKHFSNWK
ncbi:hypothetical protein [Baaleninema sp.]|uniref:hypothetical protein n=1 Tax=Baaleninema sp. TaxID=3101197 RepID=UPI003CFD84C8